MRIAVASGKGGTGKTLVATSLALASSALGPTALLDGDVEAPNAALFLDAEITHSEPVLQWSPVVDQDRCIHCGRCAEVCRFHAIASLPETTLVFEQLCHGCGSCALNCPAEAISEESRAIGAIESGNANTMRFAQGVLEIGEAMATPVIRSLKLYGTNAGWDSETTLVLDSPPGTACSVIEALRDADIALLVTEPTPFGLHDLRLAVQVARDALGLPVAVIINKDAGEDNCVADYCTTESLPVVMTIPLDREIAEAYSGGTPLVQARPEYVARFAALLDQLRQLAELRHVNTGGAS